VRADGRWRWPPSAPVQGALYVTGAAVCFSLMALLVRLATEELSPVEVAFFRNLFAFLFMLPWLARVGVGGLYTAHPRRHVARALIGLGGMYSWFTAVALLPLAEAVALNFTAPLFVTAGAALFLGEVVRARRWTATVVGFLGALVILRPGATAVSAVSLLPVAAAVCMAAATLVVKTLARHDRPGTIVLYQNLLMTPISFVPALFVWRWPSAGTLASLVALGLAAAVAHVLVARAYTKAEASAVQPFAYARLPLTAFFAYLAFGEVPTPWVWPGAALIAGAAIYITHREAQLARSARRRAQAEQQPEVS